MLYIYNYNYYKQYKTLIKLHFIKYLIHTKILTEITFYKKFKFRFFLEKCKILDGEIDLQIFLKEIHIELFLEFA